MEQTLIKKSMHPCLPILDRFPFAGIHPSVHVYVVFRLEPMHVLSLGISKLLEECVLNMLSDSERKKSLILTIQQQEKSC